MYADAKNCMAHDSTKKKNLNPIFSINMPTSTAWVILILKILFGVNLKFMLN